MITDLYIKASAPASAAISTATLMKTGQTTSYRTGDDGDLEAGRNTDFHTLDTAPLHNTGVATLNTTTARFTDTLGGQTYTDDIVLDWSTWNGSTLMGYKITRIASNWNNAIDNALLTSIGTFTTGWRLPNINEMLSLRSGEVAYNYAPFNISNTVSSTFLTSNSLDVLNGYRISCVLLATNMINSILKTTATSNFYIPVRTFTLSILNVLS